MKNKQPIRVGDIFKTTLADGRFGALRILKSWNTSFLVATTPYISNEPPNISDPLLKSVVIKKRFSWKNEPAWCIHAGKVPASLELLGNIGLTPEEEQIKPHGGSAGFPSSGGWPTEPGHDVYDEWRWDHDREAYEAEVRREDEERQKARRVQPKPKKMMADDDFWKLISLLDWSKTGNDDAVVEPVVTSLATLKKGELRQFHEALCYKLFLLDTQHHAENSTASGSANWRDELSVDGFLYSRCVVIANGREYYEKVLKEPTSMPKDLEFEALLYVSQNAYEKKTGDDDLDYEPGCSFETYSNLDGWK
jgi:hypothetical protein